MTGNAQQGRPDFDFMHAVSAAIARNPGVRSLEELLGELMRLLEELLDPGQPTTRYVQHLIDDGITPLHPVIVHSTLADVAAPYAEHVAAVRGFYAEHVAAAGSHIWAQTYGMVEKGQKPLPPPGAKGAHSVKMTLDPENPAAVTRVPVEGPYTVLRRQSTKLPTAMLMVCSHPGSPELLAQGDPAVQQWLADNPRFALEEFGEYRPARPPKTRGPDDPGDEGEAGVVMMALHVDEGHLHLHILIADPHGFPIKYLNPGKVSQAAAKARGIDESLLGTYYRVGWSRVQDRYHEMVGAHQGWQRGRPGNERETMEVTRQRKRLDRRAKELEDWWLAQTAAMKSRADDLARREADNAAAIASLDAERVKHNQMVKAFAEARFREQARLQGERQRLEADGHNFEVTREARAQELRELKADLDRLRAENREMQQELRDQDERIEEACERLNQLYGDGKLLGKYAVEIERLLRGAHGGGHDPHRRVGAAG